MAEGIGAQGPPLGGGGFHPNWVRSPTTALHQIYTGFLGILKGASPGPNGSTEGQDHQNQQKRPHYVPIFCRLSITTRKKLFHALCRASFPRAVAQRSCGYVSMSFSRKSRRSLSDLYGSFTCGENCGVQRFTDTRLHGNAE